MNYNYDKLLHFCKTDRQREIIELLGTGKSQEKIARELNVSAKNVRNVRDAVVRNAAVMGYSPEHDMTHPVPEPFFVKGTSTLYDMETGEATRQWVKTDVDKNLMLKQALDSFTASIESYKPLPKVKAPRKTDKNLMTVYPMGDPHIGMYAWSAEAGEDFDCEIAERNLRQAMAHLVEKSPPTETAVILNLGDFFHSDTKENRTARAGNALDVDGRWARVLQIGITLMIDCVNLALQKHKKVVVRNNPGNHDPHTAQVLAVCMKHAFSNNSRVEIAGIADPFFFYEFGKNMIVSAHGDMIKPNKTQGLIANYYPEAWGRTEHRYCFLGHFHHEDRKEENGLITEIFNTLASSDAWHHSAGYRSKRNMKSLVLHAEHGEVERYTFNIARQSLCDK